MPLTLGCDCLGHIHYFDVTLINSKGQPVQVRVVGTLFSKFGYTRV
jgi:Cu2+-containing amine oxidase